MQKYLPRLDIFIVDCPKCGSEEYIENPDGIDNRHSYLAVIEEPIKFECPNCDTELKMSAPFLYGFVKN